MCIDCQSYVCVSVHIYIYILETIYIIIYIHCIFIQSISISISISIHINMMYTYMYVYIYIYPMYHYNLLAPVAPFFGFPLWPSRRHRLVAFLVDGEFGGFKWTFLMGRYIPL